MDLKEMTVEEVANRWAGALPVFNRHGIDICCGGSKTLTEVSRLHGITLDALLSELGKAGVGSAVAKV